MDTTTSRRSRLPGGRPAPPPRDDPVDPPEEATDRLGPDPTPPSTRDPGQGEPLPPGPTFPRPGAGTRTGTSSTGTKPTAKEIAAPIAGILGLVAGAVSFAIVWRYRRQFRLVVREPSDAELDDIAEPLARIVHRHIDAAWLHPDLLDAVTAGNAVRRYVNAGPLVAVLAEATPTTEET